MRRTKFIRRPYETAALVAARQRRVLTLFWARRCRKTTNLGNIAFDDMSREPRRTVIAASASLLLGTEIVGMTVSAMEQAAIVVNEASAMRGAFERSSQENDLDFKCADMETGKIYRGLTTEDFAELYRSSRLELRLYFDRSDYSRLKIIAPNPATARSWGGTVLRDEAAYTPRNFENDLRTATKPIIDTDPSFRLIYASNLCADDRHPFFEQTMPPPDLELPVNSNGNFYIGQTGVLIHRVTLADAYLAGHQLFDDEGAPLSYEDFCRRPENKLGLKINYKLEHETGGVAAIDFVALLTAQQRGAKKGCSFFFIDDDVDFRRAMDALRANLRDGEVGVGFDIATTTKQTSNPSSVTVTEQIGTMRAQRLVAVWKEKKPQIVQDRLKQIFAVIAERDRGGAARRFCIAATNERYFAEDTSDQLAAIVPTELVIESVKIQPAGYDKPIDFKTFLGDAYSAAVNDNHYALPPDSYIKSDQRLTIKNAGRYQCDPEPDGKHGDTFVSGGLAEYALTSKGSGVGDSIPMRPHDRAIDRHSSSAMHQSVSAMI